MARGGRRAGAGRKPPLVPKRCRNFYLTDDEWRFLLMLGRGCASDGLRWLIAVSKEHIVERTKK